MRVLIDEYGNYNPRRYSKPWIAKITGWDKKRILNFGCYLGDSSGGTLEIEADPGDVLYHGQKDGRGHNTFRHFVVVLEDGATQAVDEVEAKKVFLKNKKNNPLEKYTTEELQAEIIRRDKN